MKRSGKWKLVEMCGVPAASRTVKSGDDLHGLYAERDVMQDASLADFTMTERRFGVWPV